MKEGLNWVQQIKLNADEAAESDLKLKKAEVITASEKIIERIAHEDDLSRGVVDVLNARIKERLNTHRLVQGMQVRAQLQEAAIDALTGALDAAFHRSTHATPQRIFERFLKEYEEQIREM